MIQEHRKPGCAPKWWAFLFTSIIGLRLLLRKTAG